jgi:GH24 family phage-related lysozyme (muramidase)
MGNYGYALNSFRDSVKDEEGFRPKKYPDPKGKPTIGYGALIDASFPAAIRTAFPEKPKNWGQELASGRGSMTKGEAERLKQYHTETKFGEIRKSLGSDIFDRLHGDVQAGLADAHYRGSMLGPKGSPKTMALIRKGDLRAAADEFLKNDEYRYAKANPEKLGGVATRMEKFADTLRAHADYENSELPPRNP